uniref:Protein lifeguard 1-like n=1 Tax=Saccoglossus kowalevskii TaxID=10224 RepID=A0ABM0MZT7_SACKO|nr:PREDICTED: protein lifeguard 1-like [Saccoglossus kowalevskii]
MFEEWRENFKRGKSAGASGIGTGTMDIQSKKSNESPQVMMTLGNEYSTFDDESGGFEQDQSSEFSESIIRHAFIRKVYTILCVQLMVTMGIICVFLFVPILNRQCVHSYAMFYFSDPVKEYVYSNPWVWWVALGITFATLIGMACFSDIRRKFPINFIFLAIFTICEGTVLGAISARYDFQTVLIAAGIVATLCEGVLLGVACSTYKTDTVLIAAGITAVVAFALTIFAFQTKIDFTMFSGIMFVFLIVLICFGILALIFQNRILDMVYASIGALIFAGYLVVDTQMMMGGKHKYALSTEEYVFAALNLYLDVVNLFIMVLFLVGLIGR